MRSREGSPQVNSHQQQLGRNSNAAEDIPLENLSRSSTPVLGIGSGSGRAIPINSGSPATVIQLRNSPRKNNSFDGGISVSSSPATSILGMSTAAVGSFSGSPVLGIVSNSAAAAAEAAEVSQETSFMGGPEEVLVVDEEGVEQLQAERRRRRGTIETV